MVGTCDPSTPAGQGRRQEFERRLDNSETQYRPHLKMKDKRAGRVAQRKGPVSNTGTEKETRST